MIVAGRRFGKTIYCREKLLKVSDCPKTQSVYVAPTRIQAKDIMWNLLKERISKLNWNVVTNESELKVIRSNGSTIEIKSAQKPGRLRGRGLDLVIFDEYSEYKSDEIWTEVARPALSDRRGRAIFAMTPKGFNHGYDIFNYAKIEPNWSSHTFKTIDSPFFQTKEGREELEEAKRNLSEKDFRQEYEASFENFSGRVYYSFDREYSHESCEFNPSLPVIVGMDFNRSPMTAALMQRHKDGLKQFGEIFLQASDTPEMCRVIQQRFPKSVIIIRPDATGSRTYSVDKNRSDHIILREHGFQVQVKGQNPGRVDRWASVNRAIEKGLYKINVKNCPRTVKDLEVISYKEGTCEPMLTDPLLGHISDAAGYAIHWEFPILGKVTVSRYM